MKLILKILFISALIVNLSYAQRVLTLKDALSIALEKSYSIKSAELSLTSSQKNLEAVKLGLMSSVDMQFNIPSYSRTLSSQFNPLTGAQEYFDYGYTTFEGQLNVTQPLIFSNGTFYLSGDFYKKSQLSSGVQIPTDYYSNLTVSLLQPLFTFNTQKANLTRAEINLGKAKRNYTRASKDIVYNVTSGFYQLYKAKKNYEIAGEKVQQIEASYNTAQNKFKAGLIAEVEALQLEIDLASGKNDLLTAERTLGETKNDFIILIGLNLSDSIDVIAQLEYKPIDVVLEQAVSEALANRTELKDAEADISLSRLSVDEIDSQGDISGLLSANYGVNKDNNRIQNIFNDLDASRSVTMTLKVPVLDWGKNKRNVESAEADLSLYKLSFENRKKEIQNEIITVVNNLNSAKARVETLAKSVELAQKSYDISVARFQSGTITSFDLQQMQLRLTDAKINSLNALIDYKIALADLNRKTLHDFDKQGN
jgi:outer membrane protein TolC